MDLNITVRAEKELINAIKAVSEAVQAIAGQKPIPTQPVQTVQQAVQEMAQQQPVQQQPVQQQPVQQPVPVQQTTYTLGDLSKAAVSLMDLGRQDALLNLLAKFGVQSLPELDAAEYGQFAQELRGLGASI